MCIIAIKAKNVGYPSYKRVQNMCDNNDDGFAIVWKAGDEPVRNYRTLNKDKFLNKYKEITAKHDASDVAMFIHARIKTHGTQKLENCHGWIDDKIGLAFAHNGILSIKNRGDMTDSETFFRDIFSPVFEIGGWQAGELAIKACIGTSKFCFMDMFGNLTYFGQYITGDDGILYSNSSYEEQKWNKYGYGYGYGVGYNSKYSGYPYVGKSSTTPTTKTTTKSTKTKSYFSDDFDDWYNSEEYWNERKQDKTYTPF